ncbi:MAG: bifunctional DNA-formamidopyrimidine glycosylase/DNA-(apurinic or apyrimidinic site) lyase [Pseudomonadota bacterium]
MPELPEVETVRRGLAPHLLQRRLTGARVRESRLRWPVPAGLDALLAGRTIEGLDRRGKYLIFHLDRGGFICHLGMSGSLRLCSGDTPADRHDHLDLLLDGGTLLRYRDPRRFGALLWSDTPEHHPLLAGLGVEPLETAFDGAFLHDLCRGRNLAIKLLLMDAHRVVGIGNIYANEALFQAGISPRQAAGRLSRPRCDILAAAVQDTLTRAIAAGGSTLRDFVDGQGNPGYFQQQYFVYARAGEPCRRCATPIRLVRQGGRASYFCPNCQKR